MPDNALVGILACSIIFAISLSEQLSSAYAGNQSTPVIGTVTEHGCEIVGGIIQSYALDAGFSQSIQVCKIGEKYYELTDQPNPVLGPYGCIPEGASGIDPDSGKRYAFPNPCDVPRTCDPTDGWGVFMSHLLNELKVSTHGRHFSVGVATSSALCTFKQFSLEEKKLSITVVGGIDQGSIFEVAIPEELLSGDFELLVDGNTTKIDAIRQNNGYAILSFVLEIKQFESKDIEIVGTHVIPEFSISGIAILVVGVAMVAGVINRHLTRLR